MGEATKKIKDPEEERKKAQVIADRERWQEEFIARQNSMRNQMEHKRKMRQIPKPILVIMLLGCGLLLFTLSLFVLSFNPSTKGFVSSVLGAFQVF